MEALKSWQLLLVDDDPDIRKEVKDLLEDEAITVSGEHLTVEATPDFDHALSLLALHRFDLVILDVRKGSHIPEQINEEEAGVRTLREIQKQRFLPVIFYSGLAHSVSDLSTPFVHVVEKTEGPARLLEVVIEIFATGLPQVNRALVHHLETIQRNYMWEFVAGQWKQLSGIRDQMDLAYLLARRLAFSFSDSGMQELAQSLGYSGRDADGGKVHPMRYYVMPPVVRIPHAGDLFKGELAGETGYWILLTPSCDLELDNAERVLLARCPSLSEHPTFTKWQNQQSGNTRDKLVAMLQNKSERFHFLPGAALLPELVVDFQRLVSIPCAQLDDLERLASLDSPFAESLIARFAHYFGRLGTPDLDMSIIHSRVGITTKQPVKVLQRPSNPGE